MMPRRAGVPAGRGVKRGGICIYVAMQLLATQCALAQSHPAELQGGEPTSPDAEFAAGHGSLSIQYENLFSNGDYNGPAGAQSGSVRAQSVDLGVDYMVADRWEAHLDVPFTSPKYAGNYQHPALSGCFCEPTFVDNGKYHSAWADFDAGLRYHTVLDTYYVTPSIEVVIPSHHYVFYGSGTVGADEKKLGFGIEVAHQFAFSNFYYDARLTYVLVPETLGVNADYGTLQADLGYYINPRLALRAIADVKLGNGHSDAQIGATCCTSALWALHDKFRLEDHANIGAAADYAFDDKYAISTIVTRSVWGKSNFITKYGLGIKLSRSF